MMLRKMHANQKRLVSLQCLRVNSEKRLAKLKKVKGMLEENHREEQKGKF